MNGLRLNARLLWACLLVAAAAAAVWASPFRYDYANSGRYLMVAAKKMDPALFPGDPVVESMARFDSLFYRAMPAVLGEPGRMESALFKVYAGLKIALMTALFWWVRTLSKEPLAAVLVLAWCGQSASALLGGVPLFTGMATHNEAALVLGILAVVCAGRRLYWGFWLLVCLSLFVHSLVTVHLLACVVPVLLLRERAGRVGFLTGAAFFSACFLGYLHWMTPPPMSAEEAALFIRAKGGMQHISPMAQGAADYVKFGLTLGLAGLARRRWLSGQPASAQIMGFAVCGAAVAFLLAFGAVFSGSLGLTQLQPMRIFYWVTLFLQVIIAWAACEALLQRHPLGWVLLGAIVFAMADSLWSTGLSLAAVAGLGAGLLRPGAWIQSKLARFPAGLLWAFALAVIVCALSGNKDPLRSLRDPWLLLLGAGLPALLAVSKPNRAGLVSVVAGLCVCAAAIGTRHSWQGVREKNLKASREEWLLVCDWCRTHSAKSDVFLTPPAGDNFRVHAFRSCVGESMSALAWIDPKGEQKNAQTAAWVQAQLKDGCWDLNGLAGLARTNGAKYLVVQGAFKPLSAPLFQQGVFSVHKTE